MNLESSAPARRPYHSPHRREQARRTRCAILDAALPLFLQRGYAGTSMADIAQAAGVSIKTVEAIFGTKAKVLAAVRDVSILGDDAAIPLAERAPFQEMLQEPDPRRQLVLYARLTCQIKRRTAALFEAIRRAAPVDPEIGALWREVQEQFMADQGRVADRLAEREALREGLGVADAAERLGLLNHPSVYYLAVVEGGWSDERFEQWLAEAFIQQLLG
jgi:AcrR family transcriptional regulator